MSGKKSNIGKKEREMLGEVAGIEKSGVKWLV